MPGKSDYTNITFGGVFYKNYDKSECGVLNFKYSEYEGVKEVIKVLKARCLTAKFTKEAQNPFRFFGSSQSVYWMKENVKSDYSFLDARTLRCKKQEVRGFPTQVCEE